ncbi:Receptor-like protein kinase 2 [Platanthera guangdongensis]|uniref:Receptor-like protein kinase 2 n=1 Tax=Platanthera guangdongensis TaxID=2320717 RepID=A0ABR2LS33_9ASPA
MVPLEVLTGHHPLDPTFPGGLHLVQWASDHLQARRDPTSLLDSRLVGLPDSQMQEMIQALDISVLCVSPRPSDRPNMKDVVALLKEIIQPITKTKESSAAEAGTVTGESTSPHGGHPTTETQRQ